LDKVLSPTSNLSYVIDIGFFATALVKGFVNLEEIHLFGVVLTRFFESARCWCCCWWVGLKMEVSSSNVLTILLSSGAVVVAVSAVVLYALAPNEEAIIASYASTGKGPTFYTLSKAHHLGDDAGDAFLAEVGAAAIYKSDSVLKLASESAAGREFLKRYAERPMWVNSKLVRDGITFQRVWIANLLSSGIGSIIESFGYSNGANILMETGRLCGCRGEVTKRLVETASFNAIIFRHGLEADSAALETIARVRLLHCMVRRHIHNSVPTWKPEEHGCAVSQLDGIHTVLLNSIVMARTLELQGIYLTPADKEAMSMVWAYVSYLLGIDEEFIPKNFDEERTVYHTLFDQGFTPNDVSFQITDATLRGSSNLPPYYFTVGQQAAIARQALGTKISDAMRIPESTQLNERILTTLIQISASTSWLLYTCFGVRRFFFDDNYMYNQVELALARHCGGEAKWRFVLAKKLSPRDLTADSRSI
jgi:hypothetical protein